MTVPLPPPPDAHDKDHLIGQLWSLVASWESPEIHPDHQSGCRIAAAQLREVLTLEVVYDITRR